MKTLRLGLKSYRTFDQAKALADKIGVVLNDTMMNESSSLALSIYSPENLASLLEDKKVMTRDEKIAFARLQDFFLNAAVQLENIQIQRTRNIMRPARLVIITQYGVE